MPFWLKPRVTPAPPTAFVFNSESSFDESLTFISIGGVGSSKATKAKCCNWTYNNTTEMFNIRSPYFSEGPNKDFLAAIGDIWKKATYDDEKIRHRALYKIVKTCLKKQQVVISAVSHGSVIVHAILLKLKIDGVSLENLKGVITIGSPQYIPWGVLPPVKTLSRIVNLYNVDDVWLLNEFNKPLYKLIMPFKVPKLAEVREQAAALTQPQFVSGQTVKSSAFSQGLMFVKFTDNNTRFPNIRDPHAHKLWVGTECHTSHRNMEAVLPAEIAGKMHTKGTCQICAEHGMTGGSASMKIRYMPTKKHYSIRIDKQKRKYITMMNKQRVYLSDIRGKYRYQRM
jgi:hypothetical protein